MTKALFLFIILFAPSVFAEDIQSRYSTMVQTQASYQVFKTNYEKVLTDIENYSAQMIQTQNKADAYPLCVALKSSAQMMVNNQKYKAEFNRDYQKSDASFDQVLMLYKEGNQQLKEKCEEAKSLYLQSLNK
ncbi:hypothetical protein [Acinetobacter shaoyimingii]|uniref:Uncharacterized protein n=1 Tax=Acinetobacter shaoyimingii TaxID=2715164 RepID=A0A6G8RTL0_9GAMM|nr:hypothetical protein [Acinetobacter shaoyimingii]QIO05225.1 hypothetical protein G8E00_04220 [Acinetobacter shaoyimingii]